MSPSLLSRHHAIALHTGWLTRERERNIFIVQAPGIAVEQGEFKEISIVQEV
jgi:hypothetical protein